MIDPARAKRSLFTSDARFAVAEDAGKRVLSGYAIVWDALSDDRGGYRVRLRPQSATFTPVVDALYDHDFSAPLGTTANGSLRLQSDNVGVRFEIDLPDTSLARDVHALVSGKYVRGMSFAMVEMPWAWGANGLVGVPGASEIVTEAGGPVVNVTRFSLDEITVTLRPSFTATSVASTPPGPAAPASYATRRDHAARLNRLKLDSFRLVGSGIPHAAQ